MSKLQTSSASADLSPGMERLFDIEVTEQQGFLESIQGRIPEFVRGTYYLAGPSRFKVGSVHYRHWLDGDGTATRLHFSDRGVHLTHRFVHSTKWLQERDEGAALYRTFGTSFEGDRLKRGIGLESPANVSLFRFGPHLLASGEQGLPFALDPVTLETRGEHTFGGRLNAISPLSAHPCFLPNGDLLNFGVSFSPRQPSLTVYRFAENDGDLVYRRRHPLPYPCSIHDFMAGDRYAAFFLSPYLLDVGKVMAQGSSVVDALSWQPEKGSTILVLDADTGDSVASFDVDGNYCLHLINAFDGVSESGSLTLTLDLFELERPVYEQYQPLPDLFVDAPAGRPRRFVLDLEKQTILVDTTLDYSLCADFPAVDPRRSRRPYEDFWMLGISKTGTPGRKFFDRLERLSWSSPGGHWQAPAGTFLGGEPVFLPNSASEREGCILCQSFEADTRQSRFLLFDAMKVEDGPIAQMLTESAIPLGFHASYYPDP